MNRNDIREINELNRELREAIDELEILSRQSDNPNITVNSDAYADAQERAKVAIVNLWQIADEAVDTSDTYVRQNGETITLPNPAIERTTDKSGKPKTTGN